MVIHWRALLTSVVVVLISHSLAEAELLSTYRETDEDFSLVIEHGPLVLPNSFTVTQSLGRWLVTVDIKEQGLRPLTVDQVAISGSARHAVGVPGHLFESANPVSATFAAFIGFFPGEIESGQILTATRGDEIAHRFLVHMDKVDVSVMASFINVEVPPFGNEFPSYTLGIFGSHIVPEAAPEPSTFLLLGSSLTALGAFTWRRHRQK